MHAPVARHFNRTHGPEVAKELQPLTGGTLAQIQALHQIVHGQGLRRNKQQPVDFPEGPWLSEKPGETNEKSDDLALMRSKSRCRTPRRSVIVRLEQSHIWQ
jgi:hypothetical protein